jgi:hypothetical protein
MKTANMAARDIGKGNNKEMARLMPKDTAIQTIWLNRNCLLPLTQTPYMYICITPLLK